MSERVEREFKEWKEKYDISLTEEFSVKTLLNLQEEYDNIEKGSNTTRTREVLLHMIQDLKGHLFIRKKEKMPLYVTLSRDEALLFYDNKYAYFNSKDYNISKVINYIRNIAKGQHYNIEVKLDRGVGGGNIILCDYLDENNIKYSFLDEEIIR